ncbi:hypothetical protein [Yoonia sp.]|uniref:hypothetical protein n=1 Tax=Yoonia sp. TaxID=2212373 RepID=UPI0025D8D3E5|nr:hypothetical protein [Yoonia sp.]
MKNAILFVLLAMGLLSCGAVPSEITSRTGFNVIGATVISPNEPGWFAITSNPGAVALGKFGGLQGESRIVSVSIIQVDGTLSDASFLADAKSAKTVNDNPARLKDFRASSQEVTFKRARCIRFEARAQNATARVATAGAVYENNVGYTCRHPLRRDVAVDFTFSSRSASNALSTAERNLAESFFDSIQFNDNYFDQL